MAINVRYNSDYLSYVVSCFQVDILVNNAGLALGVSTVADHDIQVGMLLSLMPAFCTAINISAKLVALTA